MTEEFITKDEAVLVERSTLAVSELLVGIPAHIALHVMSSLSARIGVLSKDSVTKREFVADCVECLNQWYESWLEELEDDDE
jgi:hypothetical protein